MWYFILLCLSVSDEDEEDEEDTTEADPNAPLNLNQKKIRPPHHPKKPKFELPPLLSKRDGQIIVCLVISNV